MERRKLRNSIDMASAFRRNLERGDLLGVLRGEAIHDLAPGSGRGGGLRGERRAADERTGDARGTRQARPSDGG